MDGLSTKVTMLLPGTCALTLVPSAVSVATISSQSCPLSVIHALAANATKPFTLTVTVPVAVPPCITCTAKLLSTFLKALTRLPLGPPLAPILAAPGRTCLLQFANAQRRLLGITDFLSSEMRMSLLFVAPPWTPIQYKYAEALAVVRAV